MVESGLAGVECLSGIPGLVGATPIQNVGAYGQEVSDTIDSVRAYDREDRCFVELSGRACEFSYRDSLFKSREPGRHVVTAVRFALKPGAPPTLRYPELRQRFGATTPSLVEVRNTVLTIRRAKSMVVEASDENRRSCGSFFLNPVVSARVAEETAQRFPGAEMPRYPQPDGQLKLSAAWLIERSGIHKGLRSGNVAVSSQHALALVCRDGATSHELLSFADEIRARVAERTGIALAIEPVRF
jgi:UDP-N-acetylmuramate dehydrogenase